MRLILALTLLALPACDAAGPGFRGSDKIVRTVEGTRFTLRFQGDVVEAVRTSPEFRPKFEEVAQRAAMAAEAERPNCKTAWAEGDPSIVRLGLSCNGAKAPKIPKRRGVLFCDLLDSPVPGGQWLGALSCVKQ